MENGKTEGAPPAPPTVLGSTLVTAFGLATIVMLFVEAAAGLAALTRWDVHSPRSGEPWGPFGVTGVARFLIAHPWHVLIVWGAITIVTCIWQAALESAREIEQGS